MSFFFDTDERDDSSGFRIMLQSDDDKIPVMEDSNDTMKEVLVAAKAPMHPILAMQDAFEESMLEAEQKPEPTRLKLSAEARRKILLEQEDAADPTQRTWKQAPPRRQKHHQLWKLMAQISFGIYLLLNGLAKDDDQVMDILQGHVDEVDEFLEEMLDDVDLAHDDIEERLKFLHLPLENISTFDTMLEDRNFRLQIIAGNERIEHVISRTVAATNETSKAVKQGTRACKEFGTYLRDEKQNRFWRREKPHMIHVFDAMNGNVEGWHKAFVLLQTKGKDLGVALVQLGSIVAEMGRRAGEISRQTRFTSSPSPPASPSRDSKQLRISMLKNLANGPEIKSPEIMITPTISMAPVRQPSPGPESELQGSELEPEVFILKPRTYTPNASLKPPQGPIESKPDLKRKSSSKRRSLQRKSQEVVGSSKDEDDRHRGPRQYVRPTQSASPINDHSDSASNNPQHKSSKETLVPKSRDSARNPLNYLPKNSIDAPGSHGLDSAYCSEIEKPIVLSPPPRRRPPPLPSPISVQVPTHSNTNSQTGSTCQPSNQGLIPVPGPHHEHSHNAQQPSLSSTQASTSSTFLPFVRPSSNTPTPPTSASLQTQPSSFSPLPSPSPLSDSHPFFRNTTPVQASPHSPLQRPWTAAPTLPPGLGMVGPMGMMPMGMGIGSSSSGGSSNAGVGGRGHRPGLKRNPPSRMGQSVMSASAVTVADPTHPMGASDAAGAGVGIRHSTSMLKMKKKKKGGEEGGGGGKFGWFKKAFSLSEDEKAAFEARRKGIGHSAGYGTGGSSCGSSGFYDGASDEARGGGGDHGDHASAHGYGYEGFGGAGRERGSIVRRETPRFLDGRRIR